MTDSIGFDLEPMVATPVVTAMPVVINQDGKLLVSSRNVAEVFEKEHDKVCRDIRELLTKVSAEFSAANFGESTYTTERGKTYPEYLMTKDGLMLLIMGYTGAKAMAFKEI